LRAVEDLAVHARAACVDLLEPLQRPPHPLLVAQIGDRRFHADLDQRFHRVVALGDVLRDVWRPRRLVDAVARALRPLRESHALGGGRVTPGNCVGSSMQLLRPRLLKTQR